MSVEVLQTIPGNQRQALKGASGTPSSTNPYVLDADSRNSDARTPNAHTHVESHVPFLALSVEVTF